MTCMLTVEEFCCESHNLVASSRASTMVAGVLDGAGGVDADG
jgi:hypothetical protein